MGTEFLTLENVEWLQGLADMGCTFMELIPDTKRTKAGWWKYTRLVGAKGLSSALAWLRKGSGVGILPKAPLWILDADSTAEIERIVSTLLEARTFPLMVRTPSGGAHFYFRLPDSFPLSGLKNHLCHPRDEDGNRMQVDFKFGPRSLLVAPGARRAGKRYEPASPWEQPPIVDPRMFLPNGKFWREQRPFMVDTRPLKDRISRACKYLGYKAPVSISGKSGHKTLAGVTAHLVVFLGLDPELAHNLLTHGRNPWNRRCIDPNGKPFPWGDRELWTACTAAVDTIPAAGVKAWERAQESQQSRSKLDSFMGILKTSLIQSQNVRVPMQQVREYFGWFGLSNLTARALGDAAVIHGVKRIQATRARVCCVPGLDSRALLGSLLEAARVRQIQERGYAGCPLMKQVCALPPPPLGVERSVSAEIEPRFAEYHTKDTQRSTLRQGAA